MDYSRLLLNFLLLAMFMAVPQSTAFMGAVEVHFANKMYIDEDLMESWSGRRHLESVKYLSYNALMADRVPCNRRGQSYFDCRTGARAIPASSSSPKSASSASDSQKSPPPPKSSPPPATSPKSSPSPSNSHISNPPESASSPESDLSPASSPGIGPSAYPPLTDHSLHDFRKWQHQYTFQ